MPSDKFGADALNALAGNDVEELNRIFKPAHIDINHTVCGGMYGGCSDFGNIIFEEGALVQLAVPMAVDHESVLQSPRGRVSLRNAHRWRHLQLATA